MDNLQGDLTENPKRFWSFFRNKSRSKSFPAEIKNGPICASSAVNKANMFNKYFHSVFVVDDKEDLPPTDSIIDENLRSVDFSKEKVETLLRHLDITKAKGPDNISPWVLKNCASELSESLSILFKKSMSSGEIPKEWLKANVIPIHKKGDKAEVANYRPVSLLCLAGKVMERIIADSMFPTLKEKIYDLQHGFIKGCSTTAQLIEYFQDIGENLDEGGQTDIIYLDFAKAFDTVSHRHLLAKLETFGINSNLLQWLKSYLSGRKQRVAVEGEHSEWLPVVSGVPQGSILGPILFILYINDLPRSVMNSKVALFADDAKCARTIKSEDDCILLQEDLTRIITWSKTWKMRFNATKCQVLTVSRKLHKIIFNYDIEGTHLEHVSSVKDLGITINSSLTWNNHIDTIINKTYRKVGMIKRTMGYQAPRAVLLSLYNTLIRSTIDYGSQVWSPWTAIQIKALESTQRKFTKYILSYPDLDYVQRLVELGLLPLSYRREIMDLTFYFKSKMGLGNSQLLTHVNTIENRGTRRASIRGNTLYPRKCKTETFKNSYTNRLVQIWNQLPLSAQNANSIPEFKAKIKEHYENKLVNEFDINNICTWYTYCSCESCRCRKLKLT